MIFLASDDDREGEAIFLHEEVWILKMEYKADCFSGITKNAITKAIENSQNQSDYDLCPMRAARRILDRLVGFLN